MSCKIVFLLSSHMHDRKWMNEWMNIFGRGEENVEETTKNSGIFKFPCFRKTKNNIGSCQAIKVFK